MRTLRPLSTRLALLLLIPLLALAGLIALGAWDRAADREGAENAARLTELSRASSAAARSLHAEGLIAESSGADSFGLPDLRAASDRDLARLDELVAATPAGNARIDRAIEDVEARAPLLEALRSATDEGTADQASFDTYRDLDRVYLTLSDVAAGEAADDLPTDGRGPWWYVALGLLALGLSLVLGGWIIRSITAALGKLADDAAEVADARYPALLAGVQDKDRDPAGIRHQPIEAGGALEFAELADSINNIQELGLESARSHAGIVQKGIGDLFIRLARRNQNLLDRQISAIDELESRETDPDRLAQLFRLDHLATRMRRNAESLLALADESTTRSPSTGPAPLGDVLRVAIGEVEDYARVRMISLDEVAIRGDVAVDVSHLVAELMDNATQHSPPDSYVEVVGRWADDDRHYVVSVADTGIGMPAAQVDAANRLLANPPAASDGVTDSLGLVVVARIAERLGVNVRLVASSGGGLTALVAMPASVLVAIPDAGLSVRGEAEILPTEERLAPVSTGEPVGRAPEPAPLVGEEPSEVEVPGAVEERFPYPTVVPPMPESPTQPEPTAPTEPARPAAPVPSIVSGRPADGATDVAPVAPAAPAAAATGTVSFGAPIVAAPAAVAAVAAPELPQRSVGLVRRNPTEQAQAAAAGSGLSAGTRARVAATRRSPEEVRAMLSKYRSGLDEGRAAADAENE